MQAVKGTVRLISGCRDHECGVGVPVPMTAAELEAMQAAAAATGKATTTKTENQSIMICFTCRPFFARMQLLQSDHKVCTAAFH
jgi:hypothetical protein